MNQELRDHKKIIFFKKTKVSLGIITLLLTSCFLLLVYPVFADEQNLSVSAFIGPQSSAFQFNLADQDNVTTISQGQNRTYIVTYGAKDSAAVSTTNTITVTWANDLSPNNMHIFEYVYGSASDGYGGAKAIVDTTNRTITWHIPSLPPGTTDQKLYFHLYTDTYQGNPASFPVTLTATMSNEYVTMPDQTLSQTYSYQTPKPGPTTIPTPQPTSVPTPTPTPIPSYSVDISGITDNNSTVSITTKNPSKVTISYGTSPNNLNQTVGTNSYATQSTITIPGLLPDTRYYFQITITDLYGNTTTSDIYTLQTAKPSLAALPLTGTAVISENGSVLLSVILADHMTPGFALLTSGNGYDVTVSLPTDVIYKSLEAITMQQQSLNTIEMIKQQDGIYTAHMPPLTPGNYTIIVKSLDDSGTLIQRSIADLKVIAPLSVIDQNSGAGIANARVLLSYFDQGSNSYKPVSLGMFGLQINPGYTDNNGIYSITLPPGKYLAHASAILFDAADVDFTLGPGNGEEFPRVLLKKDPFNLIELFMVLKDFIIDSITAAYITLHAIASSSMVFQVVATGAAASLALLSYLLFMLKTHSTWKYLPLLFFFHLDVFLKRHHGKYLTGQIVNERGFPLSLVRVEVENAKSKEILRHTTTNKTGKFYFTNIFSEPVNLLIVKEGYQPKTVSLENGIPEHGVHVALQPGYHHKRIAKQLLELLGSVVGMFYETALVISLIFEILFFFSYGFTRTLPFLVLSIINIILWLFYLKQRSEKSVI